MKRIQYDWFLERGVVYRELVISHTKRDRERKQGRDQLEATVWPRPNDWCLISMSPKTRAHLIFYVQDIGIRTTGSTGFMISKRDFRT